MEVVWKCPYDSLTIKLRLYLINSVIKANEDE
jgi:hypothetical protein